MKTRGVWFAVAGVLLLPLSGRAEVCPEPDEVQGVEFEDGVYKVSAQVEVRPVLFIANASEDTVSRIATDQNKEVARYSSSFWSGGIGGNGAGLPNHGAWSGRAPSRSAVDTDGNAYVANRGFGRVAEVMKILTTGCIDRNGNGACDTSTDLNNDGAIQTSEMYPVIDDSEIRDERVAWIRRVGGYNEIARALAIDKSGNLWVGMYQTGRIYKLDPATGATLGNWSIGVNPYGAAVDSQGMLFTAALGSTYQRRIDTTNPTNQSPYFIRYGYGLALGKDHNGKEWVASAHHGGRGFQLTDPSTLATSLPIVNGYSAYGISFDKNGDVVISGAQNWSTRGATKARTDGSIVWTRSPPAGCQRAGQRGAIIDANNDIWVVSLEDNKVCKYLSDGTISAQVPVGRNPYTYSDASGIGLQYSDPTGKLIFRSDAVNQGFDWSGSELCFKGSGAVTVTVAAAATEAGLEFANPVNLPVAQQGDYLCGNVPNGVVGRYLQVAFTLKAGGQVVVQNGENGECTLELPQANQPPVAACIAPVTVSADAQCQGAAPAIDNGSSDPDGVDDIASITQDPVAGTALGLGDTTIGLTITDQAGASATCSTTVTVVDDSAAVIDCGIDPNGYSPDSFAQGGIDITATATDNCAGDVALAISGYTATHANGRDKTPQAGGSVSGSTLHINHSIGIDTVHSWTVTATDGAGNVSSVTCSFTVVNKNT